MIALKRTIGLFIFFLTVVSYGCSVQMVDIKGLIRFKKNAKMQKLDTVQLQQFKKEQLQDSIIYSDLLRIYPDRYKVGNILFCIGANTANNAAKKYSANNLRDFQKVFQETTMAVLGDSRIVYFKGRQVLLVARNQDSVMKTYLFHTLNSKKTIMVSGFTQCSPVDTAKAKKLIAHIITKIRYNE